MDNKTIDNKVSCICVTLVWYQDVVEGEVPSCHLAAATAALGPRKTNANEMQILVLTVCCTHTRQLVTTVHTGAPQMRKYLRQEIAGKLLRKLKHEL